MAAERIGGDRVIAPGQLSSLNAEGRGLGSIASAQARRFVAPPGHPAAAHGSGTNGRGSSYSARAALLPQRGRTGSRFNRISTSAPVRSAARKPEVGTPMVGKSSVNAKGWD